jgi:hypothetical protein
MRIYRLLLPQLQNVYTGMVTYNFAEDQKQQNLNSEINTVKFYVRMWSLMLR